MSVLEELKTSAREALEKKPVALSRLAEATPMKASTNEISDKALDIVSEALLLYRFTVVEVRAAETLEEVAAKWKETHALFEGLLALWNSLSVLLDRSDIETVRYCGAVIAKLERLTRKHYEFHAE